MKELFVPAGEQWASPEGIVVCIERLNILYALIVWNESPSIHDISD
jgi:hypothetical protein